MCLWNEKYGIFFFNLYSDVCFIFYIIYGLFNVKCLLFECRSDFLLIYDKMNDDLF